MKYKFKCTKLREWHGTTTKAWANPNWIKYKYKWSVSEVFQTVEKEPLDENEISEGCSQHIYIYIYIYIFFFFLLLCYFFIKQN